MTNRRNTRLQFIGNAVHDYLICSATSCNGQHSTCWHFNGGTNFIIARNTFNNCAETMISFQSTHVEMTPNIRYGLVENNVIGDVCANQAVAGAPTSRCNPIEGGGVTWRCGTVDDIEDLTIRFNSFHTYLNFTNASTPTGSPSCNTTTTWPTGHNISIYANVMDIPAGWTAYPTGYTQGYNVFTGYAGGGTDINVGGTTPDVLYANPASPAYDYTLSATGQSLVQNATCSSTFPCPLTDLAGNARSATVSRAGAYGP